MNGTDFVMVKLEFCNGKRSLQFYICDHNVILQSFYKRIYVNICCFIAAWNNTKLNVGS